MGRGLWRVVAIGGALLTLSWVIQRGITLDPTEIRVWLESLGPAAPLVYVLLYTAQVAMAPIPGLPIGAAAGFAFGLAPALVYGMLGLALGATIAMIAGRIWGLRLLRRVAGPEAIAGWEGMRLVNSPLTWLLVFVGPSPDIILFVAGMSRIPLRTLIPVGVIGRAPAMAFATLMGAGIVETGPWLLIGAAAIGLAGCGIGFLYKRLIPTPAAATGEAPAA